MNQGTTVPELFRAYCESGSTRTLARWKHEGRWLEHTGAEMHATVRALARFFEARGIRHGDRVGILCGSVPAWPLCDIAILSLGAVTVGAYTSSTQEQLAYVFGHAQVRAVVCGSLDLLYRARSVQAELPDAKTWILIDDEGGLGGVEAPARHAAEVVRESSKDLVLLSEALREGATLDGASPERYDELVRSVSEDDLATIIYTSGTTGPPKGAMLLHRNVTRTTTATAQAFDLTPEDLGVVFLPFAHALQRLASYTGLAAGTAGAYAESIERLPETWREVRPTVQASVPRIWEKVHLRVQNGLDKASPAKRRLFRWAISVGRRMAERERAGTRDSAPLPLKLQHAIADRLIFRKVRARFGGRTRFLTSGGAPISVELLEFFHAMGILILEGWGLTETGSAATVNTELGYRFGTVGRAIGTVELKIADDEEILIKSPGVFAGYYKNEEATKAAFTPDGWFKTGDLGEIDADGFLKITDRKKNLIITAGGKNVAPANVVAALKRHSPQVSQVYVHGDRRPCLVALITLDPEAKGTAADKKQALSEGLREANRELARYEQIRAFAIVPEEFTEEQG
ncbi:MAG: AMP-dependent synthetase/ligase, partial [Planctomycetota bacterium]